MKRTLTMIFAGLLTLSAVSVFATEPASQTPSDITTKTTAPVKPASVKNKKSAEAREACKKEGIVGKELNACVKEKLSKAGKQTQASSKEPMTK